VIQANNVGLTYIKIIKILFNFQPDIIKKKLVLYHSLFWFKMLYLHMVEDVD